MGDDGVIFESIVVKNDIDDALSKERQAVLALETSKQHQFEQNKTIFDKFMKSKRNVKGLLKNNNKLVNNEE